MSLNKWTRHFYQPCLPIGEDGRRVTGSKEHIELSRKAASEGMVLLKNNNDVLPLEKGTKVALFGKATIDYVRGGGGSGEVNVAYYRNLYDGLKIKENEGKVEVFDKLALYYEAYVTEQYRKGSAPGMIEEIDVPEDLLAEAKKYTDTAVITISRFSGEGWDRKPAKEVIEYLWEQEKLFTELQQQLFPDSDYCLTAKEKAMIKLVKDNFKKVIVVVNSGGVIETNWIKNDDSISSCLFAWQGGIEGGLAMADILVGDVNPSGKLVDTFADTLEDYPSTYNFHDSNDYVEYTDDIYVGYRYFETIPEANKKVSYPFGYGLSYTTFDIKNTGFSSENGKIIVNAKVTNTGKYSGKEVVMLYYSAPNGILGKPKYELGTFVKTNELKPNESQDIVLELNINDMASYDDVGKLIKSAWILEKGTYSFYLGNNVRELVKLNNVYEIEKDIVALQCSEKIASSDVSERLLPDGTMEKMVKASPKSTHSILPHMPNTQTEAVYPYEREMPIRSMLDRKDIMFIDVAEGKNTLDEFMQQLSVDDLIHLTGGQKNQGVSNTFGIGNLPEYGIPNVTTADGPAGLRIMPNVGVRTTAWPCATMLACSFNTEYAYRIGACVAKEVKENNIGCWLAPAVNIHRTPMCGRNFEYYSEDPVVAGKIGSALIKGVQSQNIAATVKHFAINNKETNRKNSDSRLTERAAREIYLKVFEIIIKESNPWCVMTAYNKVNGIQASENAELINGILRGEWGYDGLVMTDWWNSGEQYLEIKAGNDLKMGNGYPERVRYAYDKGEVSKEEIYIAAKNVLKFILRME